MRAKKNEMKHGRRNVDIVFPLAHFRSIPLGSRLACRYLVVHNVPERLGARKMLNLHRRLPRSSCAEFRIYVVEGATPVLHAET
jgi:hypothetical protein